MGHYQEITRIIDFESQPRFSGCVDTATNIAEIAGFGDVVIHRHFTGIEELRAIKRLWKSRITIEDWLSEVEELPGLSNECKIRIRRVMCGEV